MQRNYFSLSLLSSLFVSTFYILLNKGFATKNMITYEKLTDGVRLKFEILHHFWQSFGFCIIYFPPTSDSCLHLQFAGQICSTWEREGKGNRRDWTDWAERKCSGEKRLLKSWRGEIFIDTWERACAVLHFCSLVFMFTIVIFQILLFLLFLL